MKSLYHQIKSDLVEAADAKTADKNMRYHKYDGHHSFGISAPILAGILKAYKKQVRDLSCKDTLALAEMLYKDQIEESILAGNFVLQINIDCLRETQLPFLDRALNYFSSWSATDDFCIDVLQPVLTQYPQDTLRLLANWNKSKNMWKRRASVVAFVRKIGESGKFTKAGLELCESLIWNKEDLVQKGVGWCLKDLMRGDKIKVMNYVRKLRELGVSSTITLYAIRDLRGNDRTQILKTRSSRGKIG